VLSKCVSLISKIDYAIRKDRRIIGMAFRGVKVQCCGHFFG
jgi:hypothetical protein